MTMKKQPWILCAAAALALAAPLVQAKDISGKAARDEIVTMKDEGPAMQKAFDKARKTLSEFLKKAANPADGTDNYALKVGLSDGRNTEYFWVTDFEQEGDRFTATLGNTPRLVRKYSAGDEVSFARTQIVDWLYMDEAKGRMMGNFTACALLTKESASSAAAFKKQYGLSCDD